MALDGRRSTPQARPEAPAERPRLVVVEFTVGALAAPDAQPLAIQAFAPQEDADRAVQNVVQEGCKRQGIEIGYLAVIQMPDTRMIHLRLPADLVERLDRMAAGQPRSAVVSKALTTYLERAELLSVIRLGAGNLAREDAAQWPDDESVDRWVEALRREWSDPARDDEGNGG